MRAASTAAWMVAHSADRTVVNLAAQWVGGSVDPKVGHWVVSLAV